MENETTRSICLRLSCCDSVHREFIHYKFHRRNIIISNIHCSVHHLKNHTPSANYNHTNLQNYSIAQSCGEIWYSQVFDVKTPYHVSKWCVESDRTYVLSPIMTSRKVPQFGSSNPTRCSKNSASKRTAVKF